MCVRDVYVCEKEREREREKEREREREREEHQRPTPEVMPEVLATLFLEARSLSFILDLTGLHRLAGL